MEGLASMGRRFGSRALWVILGVALSTTPTMGQRSGGIGGVRAAFPHTNAVQSRIAAARSGGLFRPRMSGSAIMNGRGGVDRFGRSTLAPSQVGFADSFFHSGLSHGAASHGGVSLHLGIERDDHSLQIDLNPGLGHGVGHGHPIHGDLLHGGFVDGVHGGGHGLHGTSLLLPYYYGYGRYSGGFYDTYAYPDPSLFNAPPPAPAVTPDQLRELTPSERADEYVHRGMVDEAVRVLREHLRAQPGDSDAIRRLGLLLVSVGRTTEGAALVALAYEQEPALATRPVSAGLLGVDRSGLRDLVRSAVIHANKTRSASAWLTTAVLFQGEGRLRVARRMIERARLAGLGPEVGDPFEAELR